MLYEWHGRFHIGICYFVFLNFSFLKGKIEISLEMMGRQEAMFDEFSKTIKVYVLKRWKRNKKYMMVFLLIYSFCYIKKLDVLTIYTCIILLRIFINLYFINLKISMISYYIFSKSLRSNIKLFIYDIKIH